ncbi:hypothetical protein [Streptomyces chartreusis]
MTTPQLPFAQPDKGDRFVPRDNPQWLGRLFLIYPDSVSQHMGTGQNNQPEPYEAVTADVVIIDLINPETGQPTVLSNARIGGKSLVPQIKKHCGGGMVLGRLAQSPAQGQKSGAFYLAEFSDADAQTAMQYIAAHPRQQFNQPQTQQAPAAAPAQQQWGQAPAQQAYGAPPAPQQGQPQYASQQLPYDPWAGTQAAPAAQPPAAPAGPQPGAWGQPAASAPGAPAQMPPASPSAPQQWGAAPSAAPAPAPGAAPGPAAPAAAEPQNPALVAFLQAKGVPVTPDMSNGQMQMIAATYGPPPQQ